MIKNLWRSLCYCFFLNYHCLKKLTLKERQLAFGLIIIILFSAFLWYRQNWLTKSSIIASDGGNYTEGMVAGPREMIEKQLQRLTNAGLVRSDSQGQIQPDLATSWQITGDKKTYNFTLQPEINNVALREVLLAAAGDEKKWPKFTTETPAGNQLTLILQEPFSPFLRYLTQPLFSGYGPYVISNWDNEGIILQKNSSYHLRQPYIPKIAIKLYDTEKDLRRALKSQEVMAGLLTNNDFPGDDKLINYQLKLPRRMVIFFNLRKPQWKEAAVRRKVAQFQSLDNKITQVLTTASTAQNTNLAKNLQEKFASLNLDLQIKEITPGEIEEKIIPARDFDLLLYGIDTQADPDPYPFWHSSQIEAPGLNLAGLTLEKMDNLLDEARQIVDEPTRLGKYQEIEKLLTEETPYFVASETTATYWLNKEVKGVKINQGVAFGDRFADVAEWYLKTKRVKK